MTEIDLEQIKDTPVTGETETAAERFDPVVMKGELIEAEHVARYRFAAAFANGRRVLDAGCGWGYGSNILADGGADNVIGIDIAETVVEASGAIVRENVTVQLGDVSDLEFADDSFDLVVCFEVIEHIERRGEALAEFARVLAPGGLLLISSPNRDVYGDRNPFHVFEYTPEEFTAFIGERFAHHQLMVQENWITSMISTLENFHATENANLSDLNLTKTAGREPGEETYLVAIASQQPLPEKIAQTAVMTFNTELLKWNQLWEEQDAYLRELQARLDSVSWDTLREIDRRLEKREVDLVAGEQRELALSERIAALEGEIEAILNEPYRRHVIRRLKRNRVLRKLTGRS
jgi:2-polyprenyl-3-methyl-5-hydroxy-6-metoxy-1,4-benzoquinol methylase